MHDTPDLLSKEKTRGSRDNYATNGTIPLSRLTGTLIYLIPEYLVY